MDRYRERSLSSKARHLSRPIRASCLTCTYRLQNMPFDYRNKRAFGFKVVAFLGTGFA